MQQFGLTKCEGNIQYDIVISRNKFVNFVGLVSSTDFDNAPNERCKIYTAY